MPLRSWVRISVDMALDRWPEILLNMRIMNSSLDCHMLRTKYKKMKLTHLPLDKMTAISQTVFSDALSWIKSFLLWLKFHWILFLRVQLTIAQHWCIWSNADPIHWRIYAALLGDEFMSCLHSLLGYSAREFQASQLSVLAVFGAVD